jgi:hypothetical protein
MHIHKGHCVVAADSLLPFVFIHFLCLYPRIRSTLNLVCWKNIRHFLSLAPRVFLSMPCGGSSDLLPTFSHFKPYCVVLFWTELADPRWNQLIREMNFEIRTNAHRVSVISTSVSILFRVFFIISVPPGCFRDWPPPPPPFWTVCFVWRVHVLFIHTLGFRHVVCVCVYTH